MTIILHGPQGKTSMVEHSIDLDETTTLEPLSSDEMRHIIRDLRVQQLIQKRQNEMLLLAVEDSARDKKQLRLLLENSCDVLFTLDAEGCFVFASATWERYFGYPVSDILGASFVSLVHPDDVSPFFEYLQKTLSGTYSRISPPYRVKHADGSWRWFETNGMPYFDANGTLLFTGAAHDITERRILKEQLIQAQKMEAVGELAGGLAHDFNNVLSIINGYCCLLQMEINQEQNDPQKEYLERILDASGRAGELTHSMLAFSRTQVINPQNQNLNMIVSNVGTFVKKIFREDIHFKSVIKDASLTVHVDGGQIEQLLINLANNARDAMPDGGELTIVTDLLNMDASFVSAHGFGEPGKYAVITVSDTGKGMDGATRKKIFEPFFTTKEVGKGTGLGLAMVYGIVKQHNGFVDVSSEPDQGASFFVYLPIVGLGAADPDVKTAAAGETSAGTETILIVEDDADLRELMHKMLTKLGYRVILAVDGQDAVEKFRDNTDSIQLVIMDMIMPRKSGKQAYDEIRQIKPNARALFSSGYSAKIIQQQEELGEYAEFISKPVHPAALLRKVREILDK
jgi:two-component system cell cycle sensor histidine kinase/response regulator CckA